MEKKLSRIFSVLFHPLIMTFLGMLIIFNSGTSLSVMQVEVKRITLIISALFTIVFPALMLLMLYLTKVIHDLELKDRKERMLPLALTILMYLFTFFVMRSIPQLTRGHVVFLFCPPAALFVAMLLNNYIKPSIHMLGIGLLTGLVFILIVFYGSPIQLFFILLVLAAGITGTARLILKLHSPMEILSAYLSGFFTTALIMFLFLA